MLPRELQCDGQCDGKMVIGNFGGTKQDLYVPVGTQQGEKDLRVSVANEETIGSKNTL